jgi:SET domain-containing protein
MKHNPSPTESALSTGLWTKASYINHSCAPKCARSFIGDMMLIRVINAIPKGTEIMHQYMIPDASFTYRRDLFPKTWDFSCSCRL